jgi:hypothetical protein
MVSSAAASSASLRLAGRRAAGRGAATACAARARVAHEEERQEAMQAHVERQALVRAQNSSSSTC